MSNEWGFADTGFADNRYPELRRAVQRLCADFPGAYWQEMDRARAYPTAFVQAMTEAGYSPDQWTLVQQDYPSPVPGTASRIRYPETLSRVTAGGCGMYNMRDVQRRPCVCEQHNARDDQ